MKREFLESQGLTPEAVEAVLAEHEKQLHQVRLEGCLHSAVAKAGGRNAKAIGALLDMGAIAQSQDMAAAMDAAVAQLKAQEGYLFAAPVTVFAPGAGKDAPVLGRPATLAEALRSRFGTRG